LGLIVPRRALLEIVVAIARVAVAWLPIAGRQLDFKFVELVPLRLGALAVRNRKQLLHAAAGRYGLLWGAHPAIIPLFGKRCFFGKFTPGAVPGDL
jgi:hypothetical protein